MPLRFALTVDGGVLLAKRTASVAVVSETSEKLVEHPLVTFWRRVDASRSIHRREHWSKDPCHRLAIGLCLQTEPIDHDVQHPQRERQAVVVSEL